MERGEGSERQIVYAKGTRVERVSSVSSWQAARQLRRFRCSSAMKPVEKASRGAGGAIARLEEARPKSAIPVLAADYQLIALHRPEPPSE